MKNKTLLILAAGMGSRFGGLKQLEPVGPNGEFIIDYSVYDAVRCGFNKIVFIIKEENLEQFKETIGKRIYDSLKDKDVKVEYVFQNLNNIPGEYEILKNRNKPLGTAHAVLCSKNIINEPFLMINSDDFYGYDAFLKASEYIDSNSKEEIGLIAYNVSNTITENGSVKRGICNFKDNKLIGITESNVKRSGNVIESTPLGSNEMSIIDDSTLVSMNMIVFYPIIFNKIENKLIDFLENSDLLKDEFLIPDIITSDIKENNSIVNIIRTNSKWAGVTYREDKESVVNYINELTSDNVYTKKLWK